MKKIKLTKEYFCLVDNEDYERVSQHHWYSVKMGNFIYAYTASLNGGLTTKAMHRMILNIEDKSLIVDHINRNGLDNRKVNLRIASKTENAMNSAVRKNNTTGYKGVSKHQGKYVAYIAENGKQTYLGLFETSIEAAKAYDNKAKELYPEHAFLNFGGE